MNTLKLQDYQYAISLDPFHDQWLETIIADTSLMITAYLSLMQAAGSSMLAKLANLLAKDALSIAGLADVSSATVLPLATGMALTSVLLSLKSLRPASAQYVLWPRYEESRIAYMCRDFFYSQPSARPSSNALPC